MALLDISLITKALIMLIEEYFKVSPIWTPGTVPTISPQPPDKATGDGLNLYLYHFSEDGHYKNLPAPGSDAPPVRYVPMGLDLFYQLSAHSASENGPGTLLEQKMMGIAVKACHDYPVIDDTTEINGVRIFPAALQGADNRLRIVLQPIAHKDAISYWTAGTTPLRLAAYYQISVVLLEPEETRSTAGRVLVYGIQTFIDGAPRLENCYNILSFKIPGETDTREIKFRPAQAPPAKPGMSPLPEESKVIFNGTGLRGEDTSLLLKNNRWDEPVEVDPAWRIVAKSDEVSAIVQEKASGIDILPGIYSAVAKVKRRKTLPDSRFREFEHLSNDCPFSITPRIEDLSHPDVHNFVTVKGYIFKHSDLLPEAVQVYIGHSRLIRRTSGTLNRGEFEITNDSTLRLRLPTGLESGRFYPARIFVNGVESSPHWIQIP